MKKVGGALKMLMGEYRKMAGEQSLGGGAVSPIMIRGARCLQLFNQKGVCSAQNITTKGILPRGGQFEVKRLVIGMNLDPRCQFS